MTIPPRRIIVPLLLAVGALCYVILVRHEDGAGFAVLDLLLVIIAAGLALVPAVRGRLSQVLDRIRHPSSRQLRLATAGVLLGSAGYLTLTAWQQDRDFYPSMHDEHSYALQMRMLAEGRLWMPEHPLADFFESFHILVRPVYAAIYFPGTALMYGPGVVLGLPLWVLPALAAGGVVALTYRIITELIDGAAGAMAVLLLLAVQEFRLFALAIMSQIPAALLGLLMIWFWLRWRRSWRDRSGGWAWIAGIGIIAGWAAVTRPVDALCFALPVGLAMLWELRRQGISKLAATGALLIAGAFPFFALQAVFNHGVTGSWTKTPYITYLEHSQPQTAYGFHDVDTVPEPQTQVPQKRLYYFEWMVPEIRAHNERPLLVTLVQIRLPQLLQTLLPSVLLAVLLPVGLLGLIPARAGEEHRATPGSERLISTAEHPAVPPERFAVWVVLPLFVGLYLLNTFFLSHYLIPLAPVLILNVLLGVEMLRGYLPGASEKVSAFLFLVLVLVGISRLPQVNPLVTDVYGTPTVQFVNEILPELVEQPAVVLWSFTPESSFHDEPVYNSDVAWPDDAPIINAHYLGDRNEELIEYYGRIQPQRHVYVIRRAEGEMIYLGRAGELWRRQEQENAGSAPYSGSGL
jgi:hypothetical protein